MKRALLFTFVVLFPILIHAQEWAPIGATWHYSQDEFAPPADQGYIKYEVLRDTTIGEIIGKVIEKTRVYYLSLTDEFNISTELHTFISRQDSIFYFDKSEDEYKLIYDFSAETGDTITIWCDQDNQYIDIQIDSVSTININGIDLNTQFVKLAESSNNGQCYMHGMIIQNIGWIGYLFAQHSLADPPEGGDLRCYSDSKLGAYKIFENSCDFTISTEDIHNQGVSISPNPVVDVLNIKTANKTISNISLFDFSGREIYRVQHGFESIDVSSLDNGVYILRTIFDNKEILVSKIIKM